jgi:Ca2+-binding EF-hand superfamily protein
MSLEKLRLAFESFDTDKSGALSPDEIKDIICFDA